MSSQSTLPLADSEHGGKQEPRQLEGRGAAAAAPDLASVLRGAPPGETSGRGSDQDPDWRAQAKHVFVLSNAGALHPPGAALSELACGLQSVCNSLQEAGRLADGTENLIAQPPVQACL